MQVWQPAPPLEVATICKGCWVDYSLDPRLFGPWTSSIPLSSLGLLSDSSSLFSPNCLPKHLALAPTFCPWHLTCFLLSLAPSASAGLVLRCWWGWVGFWFGCCLAWWLLLLWFSRTLFLPSRHSHPCVRLVDPRQRASQNKLKDIFVFQELIYFPKTALFF